MKIVLILLGVWAIPIIFFTWPWLGGRLVIKTQRILIGIGALLLIFFDTPWLEKRIPDEESLIDAAQVLMCIVWTIIMSGVASVFLIASFNNAG